MKLNKREAYGQKILEDFLNPVGPQSEPHTTQNFNRANRVIDSFHLTLTFFMTAKQQFFSVAQFGLSGVEEEAC